MKGMYKAMIGMLAAGTVLCGCSSEPKVVRTAEDCYEECLAVLEAKGREMFDKQGGASFAGIEGVNVDEIYRKNARVQCDSVRRICQNPESDSCKSFMDKLKSIDAGSS